MNKKPIRFYFFSLAVSLIIILLVVLYQLSINPFNTVTYNADSNNDVTDQNKSSIETPSTKTGDKIIFTGDVMLGRHVELLFKNNGADYFVKKFYSSLGTSTHFVVNFESAMTVPHIATPSGSMRFSVHKDTLAILKALKVTHASLANNHSSDYGSQGYVNAKSSLAETGIETFGQAVGISTSSITYLLHNDKKIALVGIHTLFYEPTDLEISNIMLQARSKSDLQIIYIHWGDEYELKHNDKQYQLAKKLVESGADVIIGHHPHVTQDIGVIDGVPVFYSLGNFIFDQYFSSDVKRGYLLNMSLQENRLIFDIVTHSQNEKSVPEPMTKEEESVYLKELANRSDDTLKDQIMAKKLVIVTQTDF